MENKKLEFTKPMINARGKKSQFYALVEPVFNSKNHFEVLLVSQNGNPYAIIFDCEDGMGTAIEFLKELGFEQEVGREKKKS